MLHSFKPNTVKELQAKEIPLYIARHTAIIHIIQLVQMYQAEELTSDV